MSYHNTVGNGTNMFMIDFECHTTIPSIMVLNTNMFIIDFASALRISVRNNIQGTLNLVECMQKQEGCRKLVFSSSATVYGIPDKLPLDEESTVGVGITNPYGAFSGENIVALPVTCYNRLILTVG